MSSSYLPLLSLLMCSFSVATTCFAEVGTNNFLSSATTSEYLVKNWKMYSSSAASTEKWDVQAPTTVMAGLIANNYFDYDLYQSENLKRVDGSMFAVPWIFETTQSLTDDDWKFCSTTSNSCSIRLLFHGINYKGNVTVNNHRVASEDEFVGALRRFEFDITDLIDFSSSSSSSSSANKINIVTSLHRPGGADRTFWRNPSIDLSIDFLDWNPSPPDLTLGLWRPVRLLVVRTTSPPSSSSSKMPLLRFDGFVAHTTVATSSSVINQNQQQNQFLIARMNVSFIIKNVHKTQTLDAGSIKVHVNLGKINNRGSLRGQDIIVEKHLPFSLQPNEEQRIYFPWSHFPELILTEDPPLWWPWQMGAQPLFNATVGFDGHPVENWRYGIRSSESRFTRDGAYQLYINNVFINIRGGGYDPDLFMRIDDEKTLIDEISMIRSMGLNAVRMEGMMMSEKFYDQLDELGMMGLPGIACCDGWQNWTAWQPLEYHVANESIRTQMRRLAWHPSVTIFLQSSDDLPPEDVEIMYTRMMKAEAWGNAFMTSAAGWISNVSGQTGVKMSGCYSWIAPNYFLTDVNPHNVVGDHATNSKNFGQAFGFITEQGPGASPMTLNSWNRTVGGNSSQLWDPVLGPNAPVISFHCGSPVGHFANLTRFNDALVPRYGRSESAEVFFFRSQVSTLEGLKGMFEGFSRQKASSNNFQKLANATGVIGWQAQSRWTRHLWTMFDFYHVSHGGFFGVKTGCGGKSSGIQVMMSPADGTVSLINNWFIDFFDAEVTVTVQIFAFTEDGNKVQQQQQSSSSSSSYGKTKLVWEKQQLLHSVPSDSSIPLDQVTVPVQDYDEISKIVNGGNNTYFVRISWTSNLEDLRTNYDVNWYWMSPVMDKVGPWEDILFYYTPYQHYANLTQLNTLPPVFSSTSSTDDDELMKVTLVPIDTSELGINSFRDAGARYYFEKGVMNLDKEGVILRFDLNYSEAATAIAFFIQIRIVDQETGFDVTPAFYDDNFITLYPGENRTILCEVPSLGNDLSTIEKRIRVEIETYNDIVAQNERKSGTGKRKVIEKFTTLTPQQLPASLRPPSMPAAPSRQPQPPPSPTTTSSPSNNNNNNDDDDKVSKKEYIAAVIGASITTLIALIATYFAFKFRNQVRKTEYIETGGAYVQQQQSTL